MESSFEEDGVRSDNFNHIERHLNFKEEDLETAPVRTLYKWWKSYQPRIPGRPDFDITEHRTLPSYIYLLEVLSPTEFFYRLNGEHVVNLIGKSLSGQTLTVESPNYEDRLFASYLSEFIKFKSACRCFGNLSLLDRGHIEFESLDCPLVDHNGNVTHIIGTLTDRFGTIR